MRGDLNRLMNPRGLTDKPGTPFFPSAPYCIARTLPENLWDASSSACLEAGCLDFQKARCPGHSTSRIHLNSSFFFWQLCSNIFTFILAPCYRGISSNKRDERHFWKNFLDYHGFNHSFLRWQHVRIIL